MSNSSLRSCQFSVDHTSVRPFVGDSEVRFSAPQQDTAETGVQPELSDVLHELIKDRVMSTPVRICIGDRLAVISQPSPLSVSTFVHTLLQTMAIEEHKRSPT